MHVIFLKVRNMGVFRHFVKQCQIGTRVPDLALFNDIAAFMLAINPDSEFRQIIATCLLVSIFALESDSEVVGSSK